MKYLSFDIETTGLDDDAIIIEFACIPVDVETRSIRKDLSFHTYLKCPHSSEIQDKLSDWVKENNTGLIDKASQEGISKEEFIEKFHKYITSSEIVEFFDKKKPSLMGKSMTGLDIPLIIRDYGRDKFLNKYFSHRTLDLSGVAQAISDMGMLPEGCVGSSSLAKFFGLGDDVNHTALEDSIDVAKMYFGILDLKK